MAAFLGGILGQEVLKAASGKFSPLQQHFYFDAEQVLADGEVRARSLCLSLCLSVSVSLLKN